MKHHTIFSLQLNYTWWYFLILLTPLPLQAAEIKPWLNTITLELYDHDAHAWKKTARKVELTNPKNRIIINGAPYRLQALKTRGKSCLWTVRKCFAVELTEPVSFANDAGERGQQQPVLTAKKFYLLSLANDRSYIHTKLGYYLYELFGLFPLQSRFTTLSIHGASSGKVKPYGFYLVVERPEDALVQQTGTPFVVKRRAHGVSEVKHFAAAAAPFTREQGEAMLDRLHEPGYAIEARKEAINLSLNLDHYLQWLALNYILQNGDYSDELYLYWETKSKKFDLIGWDPDNLFSKPHFSFPNLKHRKLRKSRKLYALETNLDLTIAQDPSLHHRYLLTLQQVLAKLDPQTITRVFTRIREEITPYLLEQGQHLHAAGSKDRFNLTLTKLLHPRPTPQSILDQLHEREAQLNARISLLRQRID